MQNVARQIKLLTKDRQLPTLDDDQQAYVHGLLPLWLLGLLAAAKNKHFLFLHN